MTFTVSKDQMLGVFNGKRYVFVPHAKPRCAFCAFYNTRCDSFATPCGLARHDMTAGFWKEAP